MSCWAAWRLHELPVEKPRPKPAGDWLRLLGAFVMTESVVGKTKRLREHPSFAVVEGAEGRDASSSIAALLGD